jgi:hypothetical protein
MTTRPRPVDFASDGRNAYPIASDLPDDVVAAMRRDPRSRSVSRDEFDLLLADVRAGIERKLLRELRRRFRLEDLPDVEVW